MVAVNLLSLATSVSNQRPERGDGQLMLSGAEGEGAGPAQHKSHPPGSSSSARGFGKQDQVWFSCSGAPSSWMDVPCLIILC